MKAGEMRRDLTARQGQILDYLRCRCREARPPTMLEIGKTFGIRSSQGVSDHLRALRRKGYIDRDARRARGIRVLPDPTAEARALVLRCRRAPTGAVDLPARCAACGREHYLPPEAHADTCPGQRRAAEAGESKVMTHKFALGTELRDVVSGFTGIVTARSEYLNGCLRYLLEPKTLDKDGNTKNGVWIDEQQLVLVKEATQVRKHLAATATTSARPGGPRPAPTRRKDAPKR